MGSFQPLRFSFGADGLPAASGDGALMRVTYLGRFNRKAAEADARRRFEEWRAAPALARRRSADQLVVG